MKKQHIFLAITFFLLVVVSGCSEDDADVQRYTIKVTNTTIKKVELFISTDGTTFVSRGLLPIGEFREFNDMAMSVNYTLRASEEGDSAEEYFNEQSFSNENPDVLKLNFDIY